MGTLVKRFIKLQKGTWITLAVTIGVLSIVNLLLVRKLTLQSYRFQPRVVLNHHGWPLPAMSIIITHNLPTPSSGQDKMFMAFERQMLPDDFKMDQGGDVTFRDGSKIKVEPEGVVIDLLIMFVFLVLLGFLSERWFFKPARKGEGEVTAK